MGRHNIYSRNCGELRANMWRVNYEDAWFNYAAIGKEVKKEG